MTKRTDVITRTVIAALGNARAAQSMDVVCESELLQQLDSLGLMLAFAEIQEALGLRFEPEQLVQLLLSQSIHDMVVIIEEILIQRRSDQDVDPVIAQNASLR